MPVTLDGTHSESLCHDLPQDANTALKRAKAIVDAAIRTAVGEAGFSDTFIEENIAATDATENDAHGSSNSARQATDDP